MNILSYDAYIRRLAKSRYVEGYEYDDFVQDIYLAALITPYNADPNINQERAYLKIIARSCVRAFFRRKYTNKRSMIATGVEYDYWLENFAVSGGQFERVLLRETIGELSDPAEFTGNGNSGRVAAAKSMIDYGFNTVLSRLTGRERYNVFCLRKKLREDYAIGA